MAALEAYVLWRRALCLDPEDEVALAGLERTQLFRIHRPEVVWTENPTLQPALDPWDTT